MTSKQNSHVVRRQCRGRSYVESKNKTDSGCFVDEEIDKSPVGTESTKRKLSPNEKQTNSGQQLKGTFKTIAESASSEQQSCVTQDVTRDDKEMSVEATDDAETDVANASAPSPEGRSDTESPSEEFYCLYYSSSPNSSLKRPCNSQGKEPPPILPKPKSKRSSVPVFPTIDPDFAQLESNGNLVLRGENNDVIARRRRRHTVDGSLQYGDGVTLEEFGDALSAQQSVEDRIKRFEALAEVVQKSSIKTKRASSSFKSVNTCQRKNYLQKSDEELSSSSKPSKDKTVKAVQLKAQTQVSDQQFNDDKQINDAELDTRLNGIVSKSIDNVSFDDEIENYMDELDELCPLPGEEDTPQEILFEDKKLLSTMTEGDHAPVSNRADSSRVLETTDCKVSPPEQARDQEVPLATAEDEMEPQYEFDEFMVYTDEEEKECGVQVPEVFSSEDEEESEHEVEGSYLDSLSQENPVVNENDLDNFVVNRDDVPDGFVTDGSGYMSECSSVTLDGSVDLSSLPVFTGPKTTPNTRETNTAQRVVSMAAGMAEQKHLAEAGVKEEIGVQWKLLSLQPQRPGSACENTTASLDYFVDKSNALKRRSWSFCDPPTEADEERSPFIRKVYQVPGIWRDVEPTTSQAAETDYKRQLFSSSLSSIRRKRYSLDLERTPVNQTPGLRLQVTCSPSADSRMTHRKVSDVSSECNHIAGNDSPVTRSSRQSNSSSELRKRGSVTVDYGDQILLKHAESRNEQRKFISAGSTENLRMQTSRKLSNSSITSESQSVKFFDHKESVVSRAPRCSEKKTCSRLSNKTRSLSERFTNILEYAHSQPDDDVREMIMETLRLEPELFLEDEELERVLLTAEALKTNQHLVIEGASVPPNLEPCASETTCRSPKTTACQTDDEEEFGPRRQTSDRETQTSQLQLNEKVVSAEELLELLSSVKDLSLSAGRSRSDGASAVASSSSDLSVRSRDSSSSRGPSELYASDTGLNEPSPRPRRRPLSIQRYPRNDLTSQRAASTGNIHRGRSYHSAYDLYEHNTTAGLQSSYPHSNAKQAASLTGSNRQQSRSVDSIMRDIHALRARGRGKGVIRARMVCSQKNLENQRLPGGRPKPHYFEEEIDCMKTKETGDVASDSGSNGSLDGAMPHSAKTLTVSYEGSELSDNELEDVHFIKARKCPLEMRKKREREDGGSSMLEKGFQLESCNEHSVAGLHPNETVYDSDGCHFNGVGSDTHFEPPPKYEEAVSDRQPRDHQATDLTLRDREQCVDVHDEPPREIDNGVSVFIDYKKKIMRVLENTNKDSTQVDNLYPDETSQSSVSSEHACTSTPKAEEAKHLVLDGQRTSPLRDLYSIPEDHSSSESGSFGRCSSPSFSSDDGGFSDFGGSAETVVLVGNKDGEKSSASASAAARRPEKTRQDQKEEPSSPGENSSQSKKSENRASLEIERILSNAKDQLDEDLVNNDLFDAALDRVRQRLSPREGEGEMKLLQEENSMLRQKVVNLSCVHSQHSEVKTSGETTQNFSTESSERAVAGQSVQTTPQAHSLTDRKQGQSSSRSDAFELDVCIEGFEVCSPVVGSKEHKKSERHVKLGAIRITGDTDWHSVYEAAVKIFMEHLKSLDSDLGLGLGSKSIKKLQTGVEMWTPGTLPRKGPRVELTKQSNPCVIKLKDGSDGCCDELVYSSLLPRELVENFVYQVLQHRHVILCGSQGLGKSHLAARLAEHIAQRIGYVPYPAVVTLDVNQTSRKELRQTLNNFMRCDISSQPDGVPAVIILDQLNCLSALSDIIDVNQLERKRNSPFLIGVRNKSKKGPFSSKDLALYQYFRWIQISIQDKAVDGLLHRFLKRKLSWSPNVSRSVAGELLVLFDWLLDVWRHVNQILEEYCGSDVALGPGMFYACPMDYRSAENWFVNVWNYTVVPFMQQKLRSSKKIYDRDASWEDPTKWVIMRYPWDRETSKVLHKLKKIRQVDIVLNRNLAAANYTEAIMDEDSPKMPLTKVHPTKIEQMKVLSTGSKEKMVYIDDTLSEDSDSDNLSETSI